MARPRLETPNYKLGTRGSTYYVRWWENGKRQSVSTGAENEREAKRFLAQFRAGRADPLPPDEPTIDKILDGYLANRKGEVASFATIEASCAPLRRHLGDLQAVHMTEARGKLYAQQRRAEGYTVGPVDARRRKSLSNGTIIREVVTLRAALRWAHRHQWIDREPYVPAPPTPQAKDRWLTETEFDRLLESAVANHVRLFIALALYTGARRSAILELTWSQVDFERKIIQFGQSVGNKGRATVPINDELLDELLLFRQAATCPYVIEHGGDRVGSVKTGFNAACARAGLSGVSPHVLRHTAATWMAMRKIPMRKIALYLGHGNTATTERVYAHFDPDFLRDASDALTRKRIGKHSLKTVL